MGFFDKLFGSKKGNNKEAEKARKENEQSAEHAPVRSEETSKTLEVESRQEENKQEEVTQQTPKPSEEASATPKVDMSKFRVALNEQKPAENADGEQRMMLNLNLNLGDVEISDERCAEIVQQAGKGPEGVRMFSDNTVRENLFLCCHIQQVMLPKAVEKKDEQHFKIFQNLVQMYGRLLTAKIKRLPCLYGVFLKSTRSPLGMGNGAVVMLADTNAEKFKEEMKGFNFDIDIEKIEASQLFSYAQMLKRSGFDAISLTDGLRMGFMFPIDALYFDEKEQPKQESCINPRLKFSMLTFMQEVRRGVNYDKLPEDQKKNARMTLARMEAQMFHEMARAEYVLPLRKDDKGLDVNPVFDSQDGKEHLLAVYTDLEEMQRAFPGWVMITASYSKLCSQMKRMNVSGFLINNAGVCVPVTQPVIERIDAQKAAEEKAEAEAKANTKASEE